MSPCPTCVTNPEHGLMSTCFGLGLNQIGSAGNRFLFSSHNVFNLWQWRGDSGQQWNGGYSRGHGYNNGGGYANHHDSNNYHGEN